MFGFNSVGPRRTRVAVSPGLDFSWAIGTASFGGATGLFQSRAGTVGQGHREPRLAPSRAPEQTRQPIEIKIDDRRRIERQPLRDQQSADQSHTKRTPKFGTGAA